VEIYPAIDLRGGRCVRLYQGDFGRETVYGDDPVGQAKRFDDEGASWIHVVDLDAARTGEPVNREVVGAITAAVGASVQTGGGVRDEQAVRSLADAGVSRIVMGTAAVEDPSLVARSAAIAPIAVGLDVRGREVAVRGWAEGSGERLASLLPAFEGAGASALIVTQIDRDGTGEGPDLDVYRELLDASATPIVASGGVGTLDHLVALAGLEVSTRRLAGVIVGRALYEGSFSLTEALAAVA
jgi:phosphoribosylformimino-5-aminoimidazole carboxamide ribotide isomerase